MLIKDCKLTNKDSTILKTWKFVPYNESLSHTGVDVSGSKVYSLCFGVVIAVNHDEDGYAVTVQYNERICVRYCHLHNVHVNEGDSICYQDLIGECYRYVHFEYCTSTSSESNWAVRIGHVTFYKCDPLPVLKNREKFIADYRDGSTIQDSEDLPYAELDKITASVLEEFNGGYSDEQQRISYSKSNESKL